MPAAQVDHVVFSSVGCAERHTGIPHFDCKRRIEEHFEQSDLANTFIRPTFFFENPLDQPPIVEDGHIVLRLPLPDDIPVQMVATDDIGKVAAAVIVDPGRVPGGAVEIAGDELTGSEIAAVFGRLAALPSRYEALPVDVAGDEDMQKMFTWFATPPSYRADRALTAQLDPDVSTLEQWLPRHWSL